MMEIILEDKTFVAPAPKAKMVRKAFELVEIVNKKELDLNVTDLDKMVGFVVNLYGDQFTADDLYNSLPSQKLLPTILGCVEEITGTMNVKLEQFPKKQAG